MATESWIYIDGKKVPIPMTPREAPDMGWHLGAEYETALNWIENDFESIYTWCRETFDPHVYKVFMRSVWFLYEHDAVLCRIKWA